MPGAVCPSCKEGIPATYHGLYCPNCGKPLWETPLPKQEEAQEAQEGQEGQEDQAQTPPPAPPPAPQHPQVSVSQAGPGWPESMQGPLPILRVAPAAITGDAQGKECPWEVRDRIGGFKGFFKTFFQILFAPGKFFSKLPPHGGYADPLLFAILVCLFAAVANAVWLPLSQSFLRGMIMKDPYLSKVFVKYFSEIPTLTEQALPVAISPALTVFQVLFFSIVVHFLLFIVGGAKKGFQATFRCFAYGSAAPQLVGALFPLCGALLTPVWSLFVLIVGFSKVHEISPLRAAIAVIVPCVMLMLLLLAFLLLFFVSIFSELPQF